MQLSVVVAHPILVGVVDVLPVIVSAGVHRAHEGGFSYYVVGDVEDAQPEVVTPAAQGAADAAAPSPALERGDAEVYTPLNQCHI